MGVIFLSWEKTIRRNKRRKTSRIASNICCPWSTHNSTSHFKSRHFYAVSSIWISNIRMKYFSNACLYFDAWLRKNGSRHIICSYCFAFKSEVLQFSEWKQILVFMFYSEGNNFKARDFKHILPLEDNSPI